MGYFLFLACCTLFIGLTACSKSTEKTSTLEEQKQETKKEKEQKTNNEQQKAEEQKQLETQKQAEEQKKQQETAQAKQQQQTAPSQGKVHFSSCKEANDAGYYDITPDSPAYSKSLDKDGDGVACEHKKSGKKH
ncbi:excalibur calcium-binding domain-containing protein [Bacillus sp. NPDC094106]|uniref:excalibur calcium-binding domain-containing protein n=1 Tax=Bacillus sp. NPDC094106 TaxID=3363949 RepID=UPI003827136E